MAGCCCSEDDIASAATQARQARTLYAVLVVNAVMFAVEFIAGWLAGSTALLADSLDMLGDTLVYTLSLVVIARSPRWKALSAGFKGIVMLGFAAVVLVDALYKIGADQPPLSGVMLGIGALALLTNLVCLVLLTRHRDDDVNMRSSWICSRNDIVANAGVLLAGLLVWASQSPWPDLVVGVVIAAMFLRSAVGVLRDAGQRYRAARTPTPGDQAASGRSGVVD